jgi:hypothetical protein
MFILYLSCVIIYLFIYHITYSIIAKEFKIQRNKNFLNNYNPIILPWQLLTFWNMYFYNFYILCKYIYFYHITVVLRVHCDIYQNSYNISLEFTPPSFSFTPFPHSWNNLDRSHFSFFIHECIVFLLYSPFFTFSL